MAWMGISVGLMGTIVTIGTVTLQYAINSLETRTISAHTTARHLFAFGTLPVNAVSMFISQNFGVKQYDRMRQAMRSCFRFDLAYAVVIMAIYWTFAEMAMQIFTGSGNEYVIQTGGRYLRVVAPFYLMLGFLSQSRMVLQGLGRKIMPIVYSIIELIGRILLTCVFVPHFGYSDVMVCKQIIWCFMAAYLVAPLYAQPQMRRPPKPPRKEQAALNGISCGPVLYHSIQHLACGGSRGPDALLLEKTGCRTASRKVRLAAERNQGRRRSFSAKSLRRSCKEARTQAGKEGRLQARR